MERRVVNINSPMVHVYLLNLERERRAFICKTLLPICAATAFLLFVLWLPGSYFTDRYKVFLAIVAVVILMIQVGYAAARLSSATGAKPGDATYAYSYHPNAAVLPGPLEFIMFFALIVRVSVIKSRLGIHHPSLSFFSGYEAEVQHYGGYVPDSTHKYLDIRDSITEQTKVEDIAAQIGVDMTASTQKSIKKLEKALKCVERAYAYDRYLKELREFLQSQGDDLMSSPETQPRLL